jgi:hypothetical protein
MPAPDLIRGGRLACDRFCSTRKPAASPADGLRRKQNRAICVRRALVRAPGKALVGAYGPVEARARFRTSIEGTFGDVCCLVIERQMATKRAVGHRKDDLALAVRLAPFRRRAQHRIDEGPAADQQRRREKRQEQRKDDDHARVFRMLLVSPHARGPARRDPAPIGWRPRSDRACPFNRPHPGIKQDNRCVADKTSSSI